MSEIAFPIKDLARRKFQTGLIIVGLTICTAATVFLVVFGDNIGFEIAFITGEKLTAGFSNIFSRFVVVVGVLNFLAGALIISFLVSVMMSERVRDIGVMKAIGCLTGSAFSYFMTELSVVVFISCIAGTVIGILMHFTCVHVLNAFGFSISQKSPNVWSIVLIFLAFVVTSHIFGARPILRASKAKPAEALSPLYKFGIASELGKPLLSKLGFTLKMAYRALGRRKSATTQAIICLAAVLTLTTVAVAGGIIANATTGGYVERAVCRDVILIGHPDLSAQYVDFLSQFFEAKETEQLDYFDSKYLIPKSLVSQLSGIQGVLQADARFVLEATVYEVSGIIIDPEHPEQYIVVGENRSSEALVLGIEPEHVINERLILGRALNETDVYSALIGDSLAFKAFTIPQKQKIEILGQYFDIAGVCLDPLNNGNVVYVPLSILIKQPCYNILLLKIDPSRYSQVVTEIKEEISKNESGAELELLELNEILGRHLSFLDLLWSSVMLLPLLSLVTATLCLLSYMMLSIAGQQREFGIMRALGTKPKSILKIVFTEALIITLISGAIGISAGFFVTFAFLIPEPIISLHSVAIVTASLLLALVLLSLSSLYPAVKITKKSIASIISQP